MTAGNTLLLFIAGGDEAEFLQAIADDRGNEWIKIRSRFFQRGQQLWLARNSKAGTTVVTAYAKVSGGVSQFNAMAMTVREYSGAHGTSPIAGISFDDDGAFLQTHQGKVTNPVDGSRLVAVYAGSNGASSYSVSGTGVNLTTANNGAFTGSAVLDAPAALAGMEYGVQIDSTEYMRGTTWGIVLRPAGDPVPSGLLPDTSERGYIYKISKPDGTYIGVWRDVIDDLQFTQQINTPGTTTKVRLGRSAENTMEMRAPLTDHLGNAYTDHNGAPYFVTTQTANSIGPDTDVENGLIVEVFATYGHFEPLTDHMGRPYTDSTGQPYMVSTGAPVGRRIFTGKVIDYEAVYGASVGVTVTIASHGMELTKSEVIKNGSATTVSYSTTAIEAIVKSVLDTNPGRIGYSSDSINSTGVSITTKFSLNTKLEGIKSAFDQTDAGWYWFGNPADNLLYFKPRSVTPDHTFNLGIHLTDVSIKKSAEDLRNKIYFVGGDTGGGVILYKVYQDAGAIADHGLGVYRITDRRFTLASSAQRYANKIMSRFARPIFTSTIEISAAKYDIETIQVGHIIGFRNFGNYVDSQVMQVVSRRYLPHKVVLELGELLDEQRNIVSDLEEELSNEQYQQLPTSPS
ncbi:hypothetical protein C1I64_04835 [Rathayibacter festucae DSM 15932]|uniref:Uncharacterized protein n=1 Tax=Rathayibacter festucae DSM 15932 TaxID=1328866 RepID=A0A3T0SYP7_9MICO|nr:hypothetical protein C1I64_04835 [Rathayibacter festucae DSM 15932]